MKYFAKYSFSQSPISKNSYTLDSQEGNVPKLFFKRYEDYPKNIELGINGKQYIYFGIPRNESIRRYFAHTFEGAGNKPITSTESLNELNRTFGDSKQLGTSDLILFEFSPDMAKLDMYFIKDKGNTKSEKQKYFKAWCEGDNLISCV